MRQRRDGTFECGFSELSPALRRDALAMLPDAQRVLSACPHCLGVMKAQIVHGRQACRICRRESYPPPWKGSASTLLWRIAEDKGRVLGWDKELRF